MFVHGQALQLSNGVQGREGLIHSNGEAGRAALQLLLDIVGLTITYRRRVYNINGSVYHYIMNPTWTPIDQFNAREVIGTYNALQAHLASILKAETGARLL